MTLSGRRPFAYILIYAGISLATANELGISGPTNDVLRALTGGAAIAGAVWWWLIRKEETILSRRMVNLTKEIDGQ